MEVLERCAFRIGIVYYVRMITKKLERIMDHYNEVQTMFLRNGSLLAKDTGIGYWGVSPIKDTFDFFKQIGLHRYGSFLDLGSGDGRVVLVASLFGVRAHGIEFDDELIDIGIKGRTRLGFPEFSNTKFLQKDFMEHDLSMYDVIYISPDKPFFRTRLEKKLKNEFRGKFIVHGWEFHPESLTQKSVILVNGEKYIIYES